MTAVTNNRWSPKAKEAEAKIAMLERLAQVFTRSDSVITRRRVTVNVTESTMQAPAWSQADAITFNASLIPDTFGVDEVLAIKGLNLHEVAHVLYTPRNSSALCKWVQNHGFWQAFNALEDQRIETLLTGRFPSIVPWLTATVSLHLMSKPEQVATAFPLIRGRRYLPVEVRAFARASYLDQDSIDDICTVVDEYRKLVFPQDYEKAMYLIEKFHMLLASLKSHMPQPEDGLGDAFGHDDRPTQGIDSSESRPVSRKEQERDRNRAMSRDKADEGEQTPNPPQSKDSSQDSSDFDESDESDESSDSGDSGDQSSEDESNTNADGNQSSGSDSDFDSDDFGDDDSDDTSDVDGSSGSDSSDEFESAVRDMLDDIVDKVYSDLRKEVDDFMREVNNDPDLISTGTGKPDKADFELKTAGAQTTVMARAFARELERLRADADPGWERGVSTGRVNPLRVMRGDDFDTIYDRWSEGRNDATDIECVVLLDNSGSMSGDAADSAYRSMWAIKRGLDAIDASTTVITFNSRTSVLYDAHEKASNQIKDAGATGGTVPTEALRYSQRVFAESERAIKLLFVITDGEWSGGWGYSGNPQEQDDIIKRLSRAGVLTSLAFIGPEGYQFDKHNCEIAVRIEDPADLANLGRQVVKVGIARRLASA